MKNFVHALLATVVIGAAGPAHAADWWLVSGVPVDRAAIFADVETLIRQDDVARVRVMRIDRQGRSAEAVEHVSCGDRSGPREDDALRRFACASERDRDQFGLILANMSPLEAAQMMFGVHNGRRASGQS